MKYPLFAYGSLMFPEILKFFQKEQIPFEPAILKGYKIMSIKRDYFPVAVPSKRNEICGMLFYKLSKAFLNDLDDYEGNDYKRVLKRVKTNHGRVTAYVYVNKDLSLSELKSGWNPKIFRKYQLNKLVADFLKEEMKEDKL